MHLPSSRQLYSADLRRCLSRALRLLCAVIAWMFASAGHRLDAATVVIQAARDNTLYEVPLPTLPGTTSNGAGDYIFAGETAQNVVRRALLYFDLSAIPSEAMITSARISLTLSLAPAGAQNTSMSFHRVTKNWGEGSSDAPAQEGTGTIAQPGDATWLHTFNATEFWTNPGGDFLPMPSSTLTVLPVIGSTQSWTGLADDVQSMVANPSANFGWVLIGDETDGLTARRFNSRTNPTTNKRPTLTVVFEIPEPSSILLFGIAAGFIAMRRCRRSRAAALLIAALGASGISLMAQVDNPFPTPIPHGPVRANLEPFASGLVAPVTMVESPDGTGRMLIVDQTGKVLIHRNGAVLATPFLDVASRLVTLNPGYDERGLLGFAFDPDFANRNTAGFRRIFTYTSEPAASGTADFPTPFGANTNHHSVLASWRVNAANPDAVDPTTRVEILRFGQPQSNHNGGALAFGPDGFLYIGSGDGGGSNDNGGGHNIATGNAQDPSLLLGKILRIDVNTANAGNGRYGIPTGNPFAAGGGAREIFAVGLRNPFAFSFDGADLLVGDVGQRKIEEVNRVTVGGNYGWRHKEGSLRFDFVTGNVFDDLTGVPPGLIDPLLQYDHDEGISIIGGFVYRRFHPDLAGKYIFGDFSRSFASPTGRLFYGDLQTGAINEFILGDADQPLGLFVKGMAQDASGHVYVLGSTNLGPSGTNGVILRIEPNKPPTAVADTVFIPMSRASYVIDVLQNDSDPEGGVLTITRPPSVPEGTFRVADGLLEFRPNSRFKGSVTFPYTITDAGGMSAESTVTLRTVGAITGLYGGVFDLPVVGGPSGGLLRFSLQRSGSLSGYVIQKGKRLSFRGTLMSDGTVQASIARTGATPIVLALAIDTTAGNAGFTGTLSIDGMMIPISGKHALAADLRAEFSGRYTANMTAGSLPQGTLGTGWATIDVSKNDASATVRGKLPDGTAISFGTLLTSDLRLPLYTTLYQAPRSSISGTLQITAGALPTLASVSAISFQKPVQTRVDRFFPAGFDTTFVVAGAKFEKPAAGTLPLVLNPMNEVDFRLSDGEFIVTMNRLLQILPNGVVLVRNPVFEALSLRISPTRGTFDGAFNHPTNTLRTRFSGVIRNDLNGGLGLFNAGSTAGSVELDPRATPEN